MVIKVEGGAYRMTLNFSVKELVIKKAEWTEKVGQT